ncbi:MAG: helix-turn-helix domain-containing protein [Candidatus Dormibacter sp.]
MRTHVGLTHRVDSAVAPVRLLDVNEVADVLGCGRTLVYELIGRGELRRVKIGRLTRVPAAELDIYVQRKLAVDDDASERERRRTRPVTREGTPTLPF